MNCENSINLNKRRVGLLCVLTLSALGCSTNWALRTQEPPFALQWPYQPNKAKATYVRSLTGLDKNGGTSSFIQTIAFGGDDKELNAFVLPMAVATGHDGRIAVADMGRRCVHLYVPQSQRYIKITEAEKEKIISPTGLIFGNDLRLYISDSSGKVLTFDPDGEPLYTLRMAGSEKLKRPTGVALSPRKNLLYVLDTLANKVYAFSMKGELVFSFGKRGDAQGSFNYPTHIFWSPPGELYVSDSLNFRVQIFDEEGNVLGSFGHHGDGSGDMAMPKGIAVDREGIIYLVDGLFDNVQLFNRDGDFLLTLGKRGMDFGEFWLPSGAFINEKNELYVCDTYNGRVQVFRITEGYAGGKS